MPATKQSMLDEFEAKVYKEAWTKKPSDKLPAPKDAKYIDDLATIGAFLHPDCPEFCDALQKLDDAMVKLFEVRSKTTFNKGTLVLKSPSEFKHGHSDVHAKHLLSQVLATQEKIEGFQGIEDTTGKCVSFYGNLPSDEFGGAIQTQHLAKDYVGSDHGAYTHRIQWYCASMAKTTLQLKNQQLANVFKSSGRVWGVVFDRNAREGIALLDNDFRRPELMNPWIASNPRKGNYTWPVLSAFLKSRLERMSQRGWAPDILRINLAAKLFPDKVKPSKDYRKATRLANEAELARFKLTQEEMAILEKATKGTAFDPTTSGLVSFKDKKKTAM